MESFVCSNCGKQFPIAERASVHWLLRIGASLIFLTLWLPGSYCRECDGIISAVGVLGLLVLLVVIPILALKFFFAL